MLRSVSWDFVVAVVILPSKKKTNIITIIIIYLRTVAVQAILRISSCSTCVDTDVKVGRCAAKAGWQVDTVGVGVVSLGEDDTVEWFIEFDKDFHQILLAFHVQRDNPGHILDWSRPWV